MSDIMILHPRDDVAVCLQDLTGGESVRVTSEGNESVIKVADDIPKGHKLVIRPIRAGEHVRKFGYWIGLAGRILRQDNGFIPITCTPA